MEKKVKPWLNDIAVLCIFFARPEVLAKSFESIRQARPRKLLLWQDGPRPGREDDIDNIVRCREIVENIDWECEVYKNYHNKNMGCDPSTHYAHKWAFSIVDKCIILEDDLVPSQSFYPFCKELLDKYENDYRIDRICCFNILGQYDTEGDYFFSKYGCSIGWATWKRTADKWETDYGFLNSPEAKEYLAYTSKVDGSKTDLIKRLEKEKESGIPYWEMVTGISTLLNNGLVIYSSKNLIANIGLDPNSTHSASSIEDIPSSGQKFFFSKTYEYTFPLRHPRYMYDNIKFRNLVSNKSKRTLLSKIVGRLEVLSTRILKKIR